MLRPAVEAFERQVASEAVLGKGSNSALWGHLAPRRSFTPHYNRAVLIGVAAPMPRRLHAQTR